MRIREIIAIEYGLLQEKVDALPEEQALKVRGRLAEKYYAYLDKAAQLKRAVREYEEVAALVAEAAENGKSFSLLMNS